MRQRGRLRLKLLLGVGIVASALGIAAYVTDALREPELNTVDLRFSIRGTEPPPDDIVVVGVDDVTFSELQKQWPFSRSLHAQVIDELRRDGARVIAYDVQFTEPTPPRADNALIRAIARADGTSHVVLATTEAGAGGETNVLGGNAIVKQVGATAANGNLTPDPGDVVRAAPYTPQGLKSLGV